MRTYMCYLDNENVRMSETPHVTNCEVRTMILLAEVEHRVAWLPLSRHCGKKCFITV